MFERKGLTTPEQIEAMQKELELVGTLSGKTKVARKKVSSWLSTISFVVVIGILLVTLLDINKTKNEGGIPSLFGYYIFSVETGSMEPTLEVGDIFLAKQSSEADALDVGTIVTFRDTRDQVVTHRIIEVTTYEGNTAYVTKGDNPINSTDPDLLTPDRVIAVYSMKLSLFN